MAKLYDDSLRNKWGYGTPLTSFGEILVKKKQVGWNSHVAQLPQRDLKSLMVVKTSRLLGTWSVTKSHKKWYLVAHPTNRKWVITPIISGLTLLIPFITGVKTHLLSGMSHQVCSIELGTGQKRRNWVYIVFGNSFDGHVWLAEGKDLVQLGFFFIAFTAIVFFPSHQTWMNYFMKPPDSNHGFSRRP